MRMQHSERNLSMVMDFYEMTMSNGYFVEQGQNVRVAFDVFYRRNPDAAGFSIFAGLEQIIEYVRNLHFDEEDLAYLHEQKLFSSERLAHVARIYSERLVDEVDYVGAYHRNLVDDDQLQLLDQLLQGLGIFHP